MSVIIGALGLGFGVRVFERFGGQLEAIAGLVLIAFGAIYTLWGIRHAAAHVHGHHHHHYDHIHDPHRVTPLMVFLLFAADPCIAIFPLMFAAAPLGWSYVAAVVALYEAATILTIVALVLPARAAATTIVRGRWVHRYGDAVAGAFIVFVGLTVAVLGW